MVAIIIQRNLLVITVFFLASGYMPVWSLYNIIVIILT